MNDTFAPPPISVQLYTLRDQVAVDFPAVLARLGAKGYAGVELAGFGSLTPAELSARWPVPGSPCRARTSGCRTTRTSRPRSTRIGRSGATRS